MKFNHYLKYTSFLFIVLITVTPAFSEDNAPVRLSEKYPGLSQGILFAAQLSQLPDNVLVQIKGKDITKEMLAQKVDGLSEEMRSNAGNYLFYLLEEMVTEPILLTIVLGAATLPESNDAVQQLFKDYISKVFGDFEITEEEAKKFYDENVEMFPDLNFDEIKDMLRDQLLKQKQQEIWKSHQRSIGFQIKISINAAWVAENAEKVKDNPVDNARAGDKPVLAVFSAEWCPTCKQLQPIIESIKATGNQDVLILEIDINNNGFLPSRYDISAIPVLVFFDKSGNEVERHVGFITEEKLVEKLKALISLS